MIFAELKRLHSPDEDLETFFPDDPSYFGILLQALIGPKGMNGEESFDIMVCTPTWFTSSQLQATSYVWGKSYLFVAEYKLSIILNAVNKICEQSVGSTWREVAWQLAQYSNWEFEGYADRP